MAVATCVGTWVHGRRARLVATCVGTWVHGRRARLVATHVTAVSRSQDKLDVFVIGPTEEWLPLVRYAPGGGGHRAPHPGALSPGACVAPPARAERVPAASGTPGPGARRDDMTRRLMYGGVMERPTPPTSPAPTARQWSVNSTRHEESGSSRKGARAILLGAELTQRIQPVFE